MKFIICIFFLSFFPPAFAAEDSLYSSGYERNTFDNINYDFSYELFSDYILDYDLTVKNYHYFVIYSQLDSALTNSIIHNKIASVTARMYSSFFDKTPDEVISVFIFNDPAKYESFAYNILNLDAVNYKSMGFFTSDFNTVIVRYSPSIESVTHEIIHSFTGFDFPTIPVWLDEGLASLYENSDKENGQWIGRQNLSKRNAIKKVLLSGEYKGIIDLIKTGDEIFYERDDLYNYALAQYFLIYLQERGLLERYYKYFRENSYDDPTGLTQLIYLLGLNEYEIDIEFAQFLYEKMRFNSAEHSFEE